MSSAVSYWCVSLSSCIKWHINLNNNNNNLRGIKCVFFISITCNAISHLLKLQRFVLCWCYLSLKQNFLTAKINKWCHEEVFEIYSAYINKCGSVYSVSLRITWIQGYFKDETSHKFGLTSRKTLRIRRKCVYIIFFLLLYIEGTLPTCMLGY